MEMFVSLRMKDRAVLISNIHSKLFTYEDVLKWLFDFSVEAQYIFPV